MGPTSASPDTTSGVVPGAVAPGNNHPPISNTPARAWLAAVGYAPVRSRPLRG